MKTRVSRLWALAAVTLLLALGAGLLITGTIGVPANLPANRGIRATAPSSAAPGRSRPTLAGSGVQPPPRPGGTAAPSAGAEVQGSLLALREAVRGGDTLAVYRAISALALRVCALPDEAPHALAIAVEEARTGSIRCASAIADALGRCQDEVVQRLLVEALRSEEVPARLRDALIISLAQRREAELAHRPGPGFTKGDTHVDAPIEEAFVREALLDLLDDALRDPAAYRRRETVSNCLFALGASAAVDDIVLNRFRQLAWTRPEWAGTVLLALQLSTPTESITGLAREYLFLESAREDAVRQALGLLMQADPVLGLDTAASILADDTVPDLKKSWIVAALPAVAVVSDDDLGHLEHVALIIETWANATQFASRSAADTIGPEAAARPPGRMDLRLVFGTFLRSAVVATGGRSRLLTKLDASSLVYWLEHATDLRPRQVERILSVQFAAGGAALASRLLDVLEDSETSARTRVALLVACRDTFSNDPSWKDLAPRVRSLADRLPEEQRFELEEGAK